MIILKNFIFNELEVNAFVLHDESGACLIVDPGCKSPVQQQTLVKYITGNNLRPEGIVLTHGHFDHVAGVAFAKNEYSCPVLMHRDDLFLVKDAAQHASLFGIKMENPPAPDRYLEDGDHIKLGSSHISILHVPGHSPGSICLYMASDSLLICGDVLFSGSIGRTDLFGGNYDQLIRGIREKLMTLPRETEVWPGHGTSTTIGAEYDTNPFLS
jgi:glyoxylase-like metal-dependent hydrolase (beta-lactamase superfamily II)